MPVVRQRFVEPPRLVSDHWALAFVKWCLAWMLVFWIGLPAAVKLLVILCGFDLLSCLLTHRSGLRETLRRVSVTLLLCGAVHVVYATAKDLSGFNVGFELGTAVALFYVFGELVEITLNCSTVAPIPPQLVSWLERAQGMTRTQKKQVAALKDVERISHDAL